MNRSRHAPMPLKIVAYLFLIEGFFWLALMIVPAARGHFVAHPLIFVPVVGWGLLKLNGSCYRWAVALNAMYLGGCVSFVFWIVFSGRPAFLMSGSISWLFAIAGVMFVIKLAQLRVLMSAPIHAVFYPREAE